MSTLKFKDCAEFKHYENLSSFIGYCDGIKKRKGVENHSESQPRSFNFSDSYEQASGFAVHGWPEGVQNIEAEMAQMREGLDYMTETQNELDIVGPICVVGEYLGGNPECMMQPEAELETPVVNICVDVAGNAWVKESAWRHRGAALLNLAQDLENSGQRVCIYIVSASRSFQDKPKWNAAVIRVKAPDEDFNLHGLAYSLAHPSMFRRHLLRNIEGTPLAYAKNMTKNSYGTCKEFLSIEGLGSTMGDIDMHVPSMNTCAHHCDSVENAGEYIYAMAREQGLIQ